MRLKVSRSANSETLYMIKSTYENGKNSSKIVERLGTPDEISKEHPGIDPYVWAKKYIAERTAAEKADRQKIMVAYQPGRQLKMDEQQLFFGGYLFLQKIFYELGLGKLAGDIKAKHRFSYDLAEILSYLVCARMLEPSSKRSSLKFANSFLKPPSAKLQHVYRALGVLSKQSDQIQAALYKNSKSIIKRADHILYYDCTNFYFEIEDEDGIKKYGHSKENRPNPIVQMGLFMDGSGIPLAFCITPGNANEQTTLIPLEEKILSDFEHARFVVCTDAGLSSAGNRKYNSTKDRKFITTQSVKKLKGHLRNWATDPEGWFLVDGGKTYNIANIDEDKHIDDVFFKDRWINEGGFEQRLIVTYSVKYRNYQRGVRDAQVKRALKAIDTGKASVTKKNQNDPKRFISRTTVTSAGEVAEKDIYSIDTKLIASEEIYDGIYGVCTDLEDSPTLIAKVCRGRWEIEECFRIMKHEFKARPVYLSREDRIQAHFLVCFVALTVFRIMEKKLGDRWTCSEIIDALTSMNYLRLSGEGYAPTYTRTNLTDALHDVAGFRTDTEIITNKEMKKIISDSKKA